MNKHIIENEIQKEEKDDIGNELDDFDFLHIIKEQTYGYRAKVKSKKNQKIYCIQIIDFSFNNEELNNFMNQIQIIKDLKSRHIIKCYAYFSKNSKHYIITEFTDNNIKNYIEANSCIKRAIPENEVWDLLYQSISGLFYIQKKNLIQRDIIPENFYLTDDKNVKFDIFCFSIKRKIITELDLNEETNKIGTQLYMCPEMLSNQPYNNKFDVYSLGCIFHEICFFNVPRYPVFQKDLNGKIIVNFIHNKPKYNINYYSDDLINIIKEMIEEDPKNRPDTETIFRKIIEKYNSFKIQNSSIFCVYNCLLSFSNFVNNCEKVLIPQIDQIESTPIFRSLIMFSENVLFNNKEPSKTINQIRDILIYNNSNFPAPGEIECIDLIDFIIKKVFIETNQNKKCVSSNLYTEENDNDTYNRELSLYKYLNAFSNCFVSFVSKLFFGTFELNRICLQCKNNRTFFENFYYLTININTALISGYNFNDQNFIYNCLQNNLKIQINKYCPKCKNITLHEETKEILSYPINLIIYIKNDDNTINIKYPIEMNLPNKIANSRPIIFCLKSVIYENKQNDQRIYGCSYKIDQDWLFLNLDNTPDVKGSPYEFKYGNAIMLFYSSFNDQDKNNYNYL